MNTSPFFLAHIKTPPKHICFSGLEKTHHRRSVKRGRERSGARVMGIRKDMKPMKIRQVFFHLIPRFFFEGSAGQNPTADLLFVRGFLISLSATRPLSLSDPMVSLIWMGVPFVTCGDGKKSMGDLHDFESSFFSTSS